MKVGGDPDSVEFSFYDGKAPFQQIQSLDIPKEHFNAATMSKNLRTGPDRDTYDFIGVLFTNQPHDQPVKLMRFFEHISGDKI